MAMIAKFKKLLEVYSNLDTYQALSAAEKHLQHIYEKQDELKKINKELQTERTSLKEDINKLRHKRAMSTLSEDEARQVIKKQMEGTYAYYYEKINHEISENVSNGKWTFQLYFRDIKDVDRDALLLLSKKFAEDKIKINVREPEFETTGVWAAWTTFVDVNVRAKYVDTNTNFNYY
jgi:regulator of replication initiation timing